MSPDQERKTRRSIVKIIGYLDAKIGLDRMEIEDLMDDLIETTNHAGWSIPKPNSRR